MKRIFSTIGLIVTLIFSSFSFACTKDDVEKAAKWGFDSSARLRTGQGVVLELYQASVITLVRKDQFFNAAKFGFEALEEWNNAVEEQNNLVKAGQQTIPAAKLVLQKLFTDRVLDKINKVFLALNLMDAIKASKLFNIIKIVAKGALKVMGVLNIPKENLVEVRANG